MDTATRVQIQDETDCISHSTSTFGNGMNPKKVPDIGLGVRVFANGPGDLGSIPGRFIPKTQKMVLDASFLNTQHYKVRIKGKVEQSREGEAPSPTPWCSSYWKGSLRVTLDYGRQLYFTLWIQLFSLQLWVNSRTDWVLQPWWGN